MIVLQFCLRPRVVQHFCLLGHFLAKSCCRRFACLLPYRHWSAYAILFESVWQQLADAVHYGKAAYSRSEDVVHGRS